MSFKWCKRGNKCNTKDCTFGLIDIFNGVVNMV